jgi:titin
MMMRRILTVLCLFAVPLLAPVQRAPADTITVTTTAVPALTSPNCAEIEMDDLPGPDGQTSLREAICVANNTTGPDTINFAISGCSGTCTIQPPAGQPLPVLTDDGITIDGYSQTGASEADGSSAAQLVIVLDGQNISGYWGITINSANNHIKGLVIHSFGYSGIGIGTNDATGNLITGNYIGTSANGYTDLGNDQNGVHIALGASNNTIGGDTPAERNLISGNNLNGVFIQGTNVSGNIVSGNYIGTDAAGTSDLANTSDGVRIGEDASNNTIGGDAPGEGNVISGNNAYGVRIYSEGSDGNIVSGNLIGLDYSGSIAVGNYHSGVSITGGADDTVIGGDTPAERNVICGNGGDGINVSGLVTQGTVISGNYIGLAADGVTALQNEENGVRLSDVGSTTIVGGDTPGERNLISANHENGININGDDTGTVIVSGNYIGTDVSGTLDRGNTGDGVEIENGADGIQIGGTTSGEGNLISGNGADGVFMCCGDVNEVTIFGNYIGTDATGSLPLGNDGDGIAIAGNAFGTTIGGDTPAKRNVICDNQYGIFIEGTIGYESNYHEIKGNYIGLGADGLTPLGNNLTGILVSLNAKDNLIGGENPGEGNIITYNGTGGVSIGTPSATGNFIHRNSIFANNGVGKGITLSNGSNGELQLETPSIDSIDDPLVTVLGTAIGASTVELFASPDADGEGYYYMGSTVTSGAGDFSFQFDFLPFPYLTVTSSYDYDGINFWDGTTMFSDVYAVGYRAHFLPMVSYP